MKKLTLFTLILSLLALAAFPVAASQSEGGASTEDLLIKIAVSLLIGLTAALITVFLMKRSMSTVRKQKNAGTYVQKDSFRLTESRDIYLYSTVTRTRINTSKNKR